MVDDELLLLKLTSSTLLEQGYRVLTAESAEQALDILKNKSVNVLLTDVVMNGMNGYQLAAIVKKKYPDIKIQLISGFSDDLNGGEVDAYLQKNLLYKPFTSQALLQSIVRLNSRALL